MTNQTIHTGPALEKAAGAILLIHGRGSSGHDILSLAKQIPAERVAWLAPSASRGSWYPQRFLAPLEQNEPWLGQSLDVIDQLVSQAVAAGIPSERIGLTGFSQGGCLALEYAARNPRRYGFVAGLSGALIGPLETPRPKIDLCQTPVLLGCAEHDAHVPFEYVEHSARLLADSNAATTIQKFPGNFHTIFPEELDWLSRRVAEAMEP